MAYEGPKYDRNAPQAIDPKDPNPDPYAAMLYREHLTREKMVHIEKAKLLKEEVRNCYFREGVNYIEKCEKEVKAYMAAMQNAGFQMNNSDKHWQAPTR